VSITIYDATGRLVRRLVSDTDQGPGRQLVAWNGRDDGGRRVASGVYVYEVTFDGDSHRRRMVLLK
jgi:flagellar hook assembly protein FlgD